MKRLCHLLSLCACLALSACSGLSAAPPPSVYDLGPAAQVSEGTAGEPRLQVQADPALQGTEIVYRLMYLDARRVESYRDSRWLAPPAELLAARLSAGLRVTTPLRLQLVAFEQEFSSPTQSQVHVRVRAWQGLPKDAGKVKDFELTLAAAPDAAGAVAALSRAVEQLAQQLTPWAGTP